jgi:transposase-like protein
MGVILVECQAIHIAVTDFRKRSSLSACGCTFNFTVSLREVELMIAYRRIQLSYETVCRWCDTFGVSHAAKQVLVQTLRADKMD